MIFWSLVHWLYLVLYTELSQRGGGGANFLIIFLQVTKLKETKTNKLFPIYKYVPF